MDSDVINLRDQVAVLRRRWRVIVLCVVVAVGIALAAANLQRPTYSATAEVLVAPVAAPSTGGEVLASEEVATQVQVITSQAVATRVRQALGLPAGGADLLDSVTVEPVENTRVLAITAERSSAQGAADVANAFAAAYLRHREAAASREAMLGVQALQSRYSDLQDQLGSVQTELAGAVEGAERAALVAQERSISVQMRTLLRRLAVANTVEQGGQSGGQVLVAATAPAAPAQRYVVIVGLALGLLLGVGLAFVRDHFDDRVRDEARLRAAVGPPVLGRIPHWPRTGADPLVTIAEPEAPASEAYRSLSSSVRFLLAASRTDDDAGGSAHRTVLVTSPSLGEGRTTVASNLAVAAARFGLTVVLVDADLRDPALARGFGVGSPAGLADLLAGGGDVGSYLLDSGVDGLRILPGGSPPPGPAELLASRATSQIMGRLRAQADLVIIDSGPVLPVADTRELVPSVDDVLLVVRHARTTTRAAVDALERIREVGGAVSGVVLNDVRVAREGRRVHRYRQAGRTIERTHPSPESASAAPLRGRAARAAFSRSREL